MLFIYMATAQANSVSYPQWGGELVVAHWLWSEGLVRRLERLYVCGAAPRIQFVYYSIMGNG